jgi:hypothetical protein
MRHLFLADALQVLHKKFSINLTVIFSSTDWTVSFEHFESSLRWPKHLECCFKNLSFKKGIHKKVEFEATYEQKRDTETVSFQHCPAVDFIDIEILKEFPNLNGLKIGAANIPFLKNIFTVELKMVQ